MSVATNYGNILKEIQMNNDEINYVVSLIKTLSENGIMVEWGTGGSTCKWLETLDETQKLISIEHNNSWYEMVSSATRTHFGDISSRFTYLHVPEENNFKHGYASILEEHPAGLASYINPDIHNFFDGDLYFIDGLARAVCALTVLIKHTKPNPILLIHDYCGREHWYDWLSPFFSISKVGTTLVRLFPKQNNFQNNSLID